MRLRFQKPYNQTNVGAKLCVGLLSVEPLLQQYVNNEYYVDPISSSGVAVGETKHSGKDDKINLLNRLETTSVAAK